MTITRRRMASRALAFLLVSTLCLAPNPVLGQAHNSSSQAAVPGELSLSLSDAVTRALTQNLSVVLEEQRSRSAEASVLDARSDLLPTITGRVGESRQRVNLAAFGFSGFPGVPSVVGPFNVFDARLYVVQPVFDLKALYGSRAAAASRRAAGHGLDDARDVVVAVASTLYLQALAAESRLQTLHVQKATADALLQLARDRRQAGLTAGIDVLRAELQVQREQQRLIEGQNAFDKAKLQLARAIGLPMEQPFRLSDRMPDKAMPHPSVEEALRVANESRADLRAAAARVEAAEAARRAARGESLPTFVVSGDYGDIGQSLSTARSTFTVSGSVRVPIFEGTKGRGRLLEADATLAARKAEYADLRNRVAFDVRSALLDADAAQAALAVADTAVSLAEQQLTHARDRFAAGVADTLEVTQAQEAVALANDSHILSLSALHSSKVALARALGTAAEESRGLFLEQR